MSAAPLVLPDPSSSTRLTAPSSSTFTSDPSPSSPYGYSTSPSPYTTPSLGGPRGNNTSSSPAVDGISDQHSRSASFPLSTSPYPPSGTSSSRQLPPGASYAPENLHHQRQAPSLPPTLNLEYAGRGAPSPSAGAGVSGGEAPRQPEQGPSSLGRATGNGMSGSVTERGSSSNGGLAGSGAERPGAAAVEQQQGRRPMLLPDPPRQDGLYGAASSSPSSAHQSRPSLPLQTFPPAAPPPQHPPQAYYSPAASAPLAATSPSASSPSTAPIPPPLHQRSSFTGIPGGRLAHGQPPSTRAAADAAERASNIPSFIPAAAFSPADRGPYPPHMSPTRSRREGNASSSSLSVPAGLVPPPLGGGASGEEELLVTPTDSRPNNGNNSPTSPSAFSPTTVATTSTSGNPFSLNIADGRPGSLAFSFSDLPDDMAGIGRNSIIRAATSPVLVQAQAQAQGQRASPPRPGSGPKSPQLVGPSPQALQSAQQAQPGTGVGGYASTSVAATGQPAPPPPQAVALSPPPPPAPPQQLPPHLVPQPEVCVECMMRDRDMADVDVTGEGVWERESDKEWEEQLRWEGENPLLPPHAASGESSGEHGSQESGVGAGGGGGAAGGGAGVNGLRARRASGAASFSRESVGGRSSNAHGAAATSGRRRLGRGQGLTTGNLKVLTSMNPPAAAHRWRTLQTYLATQIHLIELERQAREAAQREEAARAAETRPRSLTSTGASIRNCSSSLLSPASLAAEKLAIEQEERQARLALKAVKTRSRATLADETNRYSSASLLPPSTSPTPMQMGSPQLPFAPSSAASIRSYSAGDQPWLGNQLRRFSSSGQKDNSPPKSPAPSTSSATRGGGGGGGGGYGFGFGKFARSTTDLRSSGGAFASPRSVSPARTSVGLDDGRRTSMWSRFRQSASASVLSFAPSGSMMDMHLGLSQDKHNLPYAHHPGQQHHHYPAYDTYPSMSDPAVARHAEQVERDRVLAASNGSGGDGEGGSGAGGKKKKKGIKGFFNKLVGGGGGKKGQVSSVSAPSTPGADLAYGPGGGGGPYGGDDDELAPPPPLSALVNEPRYHQRSASNSSVDSFGPYTPPLHPANFRASTYIAPMGVDGAPYRATPADRQSILTMGSYTSRRSQPGVANGANGRATIASRNSFGRPSLDSLRDPNSASLPRLGSPEPVIADNQGEPEVLVDDDDENGNPSPLSPDSPLAYPQPRLQKSLPSLPSEAMYYPARQPSHDQEGFPTMLPPPNLPYAHYNASRSAQSLAQIPSRNGDDLGGYNDDERRSATVGRKSRSRSKVFSMSFGGFGKSKSKQNLRASNGGGGKEDAPPMPAPPVPFLVNGGRGNSLDSAVALGYAGGGGEYDGRDSASSFRYVR